MHSVNLMLPKEERKAMLLRIFNDDSPLIDHNKERNLKPATDRVEEDAEAAAIAPEETPVEDTMEGIEKLGDA